MLLTYFCRRDKTKTLKKTCKRLYKEKVTLTQDKELGQ